MKIIITEDKLDKLHKVIEDRGILPTIKLFGGFNNFKKITPDYFKSREDKIDLINELVKSDTEAEGRIYMGDIADRYDDLVIRYENRNNGHTLQHEIDYVQEDILGVTIWEIDKDGGLLDDPWDYFEYSFDSLNNDMIETIFNIMVKYYLR
jgi:hypothetical protein